MPVKYSFLSVQLKTGIILADLPDLVLSSFKTTIGRYETATAELPLSTAPHDWESVVEEGKTVIVVIAQQVDQDGYALGSPVPVGGAAIVRQTRTDGDVVGLDLVTLESYFDRRYVGDENYVGVGQNDIVEDLINTYVVAGPNGGVPFRVQIVTSGDGVSRDREYKDKDDKTIYSVLTDLMSILGGPEWYVGWEWTHSPERITPVVYVGDRIGAAAQVGLGPSTTFEMPGCVVSFEYVRDYSSDKGANIVMATSSGQGDIRPQSPLQTYTDSSAPSYEFRWTPSTSITEVSTLTAHAQRALQFMRDGASSLALKAVLERAPMLGVDWALGDDIGFVLGGDRVEQDTDVGGVSLIDDDGLVSPYGWVLLDNGLWDTVDDVPDSEGLFYIPTGTSPPYPVVPAFPKGFSGTARVVGWELDFNEPITVTPTLVLGGEEE